MNGRAGRSVFAAVAALPWAACGGTSAPGPMGGAGGADGGSGSGSGGGRRDAGPGSATDGGAPRSDGGAPGAGTDGGADGGPDCAEGRVACAEACCAAEEVCVLGRCTAPGATCRSAIDCTRESYCDPAVGRCLPRDAAGAMCEYHPPAGQFAPRRECKWVGSSVAPARNDVVMTPVVANLTDDNGDGRVDTNDIPDVAFTSYDLEGGGCCNEPATLRVISGDCTSRTAPLEHFSVAGIAFDNSAGLAVGDLDGDGFPEIVGMLRDGGVIALAHDGTEKWRSAEPMGADAFTAEQPSLANLDGRGPAEVIVGRVVLDGATGARVWAGTKGRGVNAFLGPVSIVADLDLDGAPEVVAGNTVYDARGRERWTYDFGADGTGCPQESPPCDGYAATGNLDDDPQGEVVLVREGFVYVLGHDGRRQARITIPRDDCTRGNEGGPPTVADFDGDGRAEVGVAGADFYAVLDLDCLADPLPAGCHSRGVLWAVPNEDCSSRATGSSVFDFDGDGQAEVVYNDETRFRIFRGRDGAIVYEEANFSHTRLEMPIVADVDADGNAEVVFIENGHRNGEGGVEIWGDANDNWVPTRRIWNQHAYHVTNVEEDGRIPLVEPAHWSVAGFNNFRQNVQVAGVFEAPDLVVTRIDLEPAECPDVLGILVTVANVGARGVARGVKVAVYREAEAGGARALLGTTETATALLPGADTRVTVRWPVPAEARDVELRLVAVADDDGTGAGAHNECREDNGALALGAVRCRCEAAETCNDADDDCDGQIDENVRCPDEDATCYCGACVTPCFRGECARGLECVDDRCVAAACAPGRTCGAERGVCE